MSQNSNTNHPLRTEAEYDKALARVFDLMQIDNLQPGQPEGDEFELLCILIESYEAKHYPIPPPHPIEAIKFMMDQKGISEHELSKILGSRSRKSEILAGKRKLSLEMIRKLSSFLGISTDILTQAY